MGWASLGSVTPGQPKRLAVALTCLALAATLVIGQVSVGQEPGPSIRSASGRSVERRSESLPPRRLRPRSTRTAARVREPVRNPGRVHRPSRTSPSSTRSIRPVRRTRGLGVRPRPASRVARRERPARLPGGSRCTDAGAGLDAYATCVSLVIALATPEPTPEPTPSPTPVAVIQPRRQAGRRRDAPSCASTATSSTITRVGANRTSASSSRSTIGSESGLLPSTLLAKFLGGAAERSRSIAKRMERVDPYAPMRELVGLQIHLLRDEATMLRQYAEFAREPTDAKLNLAERSRTQRGDDERRASPSPCSTQPSPRSTAKGPPATSRHGRIRVSRTKAAGWLAPMSDGPRYGRRAARGRRAQLASLDSDVPNQLDPSRPARDLRARSGIPRPGRGQPEWSRAHPARGTRHRYHDARPRHRRRDAGQLHVAEGGAAVARAASSASTADRGR